MWTPQSRVLAQPLRTTAETLAIAGHCEVVLLGSIATGKYVETLLLDPRRTSMLSRRIRRTWRYEPRWIAASACCLRRRTAVYSSRWSGATRPPRSEAHDEGDQSAALIVFELHHPECPMRLSGHRNAIHGGMKRIEFTITGEGGQSLREPSFVEDCAELPLRHHASRRRLCAGRNRRETRASNYPFVCSQASHPPPVKTRAIQT
jgi:hypothetical protein